MLKVIFLAFFSVLLSACFYAQNYSNHWAPTLQSNSECMNVEGIYINDGRDAEGVMADLALLLFPTWTAVRDNFVTHVEIQQNTENIIKVVLWDEQEKIAEKDFCRSNGNFNCESGYIIIEQPLHRPIDPYLLGVSWGGSQLRKNSDGDLIIKNKRSTMGLLLIVIPCFEKDWLWYRFKRLQDSK